MAATSPPFAPGASSLAANASLMADLLGKKWIVDGADWRMVKAAGALTSMGRAVVVSAESSALPTWICTTSTTASDDAWVGVCKSTQVDLATGDFFLVQCSGTCEMISAAAIADGAVVGCSTTAKKVDDASIVLGGIMGYARESAAGADENIAVSMISR